MKKDSSFLNEFFSLITPNKPFKNKLIPAPPDYQNADFWASIPGKKSVALLQPNKKEASGLKDIDCFFVHPTGFFLKEWNFNLDMNLSLIHISEPTRPS